MYRTRFFLITALLLGGAVAAGAAFTPIEPSIRNRPQVLLETNYYVFGENTNLDNVELTLTLSNELGYNRPVRIYLYWQNRSTGEALYFNARENGFRAAPQDMFGSTVITPSLINFKVFGENSAFGNVPASITKDTGLYQFVVEVRNSAGNKVIARSNAMYNEVDAIVPVSGDISDTQTWTNNNAYYLETPVNVRNTGTLNIEPGTVIYGSTAGQGTMVVRRGGKIFAEGNVDQPIIFTSENLVGDRAPGDWGGLVINGRAPTNQESPVGEGDSGEYGGNQPNHSSGVLRYVRVEFAGIRFSEQNELNGIALQGVGRGTVVDHVQVHFNQDDGIEFFGGTVDAKYILITDARDDSLDWTFGWQGRLQHFVALQRHEQADKGIEADNFSNNPSAQPTSNPTIYNATFVGNGPIAERDASADTGSGMLLRRGTFATIGQAIVTNFFEEGLEVDGDESNAAFGTLLTISDSFFYNNERGDGFNINPGVEATLMQAKFNNSSRNAALANPRSIIQPDVAPLKGSAARGIGANQPNDGWFDKVDWAGGVNPDTPWINEGWTTFSDN